MDVIVICLILFCAAPFLGHDAAEFQKKRNTLNISIMKNDIKQCAIT
jgi:hypothetical protein